MTPLPCKQLSLTHLFMATKTPEQKAADKAAKDAKKTAAETARRAALTQEERDAEDAAAVKSSASKPTATEPITVKHRDHNGKPTERTFSKEVHGDDFANLAEEFKATNASKLITE
jgi:hypothetical protein